MAQRRIGPLILGIFLGGMCGAVLSFFLRKLFYPGPVSNFFFKPFEIGFSPFTVNLGFFTFTLGLTLSITVFTILLIFLALYLLYKFF